MGSTSVLAVAFVAVVATAVTHVEARASDLAVRGSAIAAETCGRCHAVGVDDASPQKVAPPFRTFGEDHPIPMLVDALKTGIVGGHEEMPMFDLGLEGVEALVAYIDSLTGAGPKYLGDKR
jgi:mono/diheme cytochrome c family protein